MRTLVTPDACLPSADVTGCSIPCNLLYEGRARLYRVDVFTSELINTALWEKRLHGSRLVTAVLHETWLLPAKLLSAGDNPALGFHKNISFSSSGTYDGLAIEIKKPEELPSFGKSPVFHVISVKRTDLVLKLAVVGPGLFHPTRVSSNILTDPLHNNKRNKYSAIFNACTDTCH